MGPLYNIASLARGRVQYDIRFVYILDFQISMFCYFGFSKFSEFSPKNGKNPFCEKIQYKIEISQHFQKPKYLLSTYTPLQTVW